MVRYRRNLLPGGTFFFTAVLADRRSSLLVDHIDVLRAAFRLARAERPFSVEAIVILPDHLHAILTLPDADAAFSSRWRRIKARFTRDVAAKRLGHKPNSKGEYDLWQRRFWEHTIRDDADFASHVDYIHYNPIKHGLVSRAVDWPYSSFHRYVRVGLLPSDWGGTILVAKPGRGEPRE
jgi:putative transposase